MLSAAYARPIQNNFKVKLIHFQNNFKVKLHPSPFVFNFAKVTAINSPSFKLNYYGVRGDGVERNINAKSCVCLTNLNK